MEQQRGAHIRVVDAVEGVRCGFGGGVVGGYVDVGGVVEGVDLGFWFRDFGVLRLGWVKCIACWMIASRSC